MDSADCGSCSPNHHGGSRHVRKARVPTVAVVPSVRTSPLVRPRIPGRTTEEARRA